MSVIFKPDDFLLQMDDRTNEVMNIVHKYDAFLDALTTPEFSQLRESTREAIRYFVSNKYPNTEEIAKHTFSQSKKLQAHYGDLSDYLNHIQIKDKKSFSIDLATGTGKSWVIYAVAQIMLSEGLVDKVLVLCPSLTIEEELKAKFERFSGNQELTKILQELDALYPSPSIKSANDPILNGDICVENIHAVYDRTGSSIKDSFKGKGQRTLVISDEAHHIYSQPDVGGRTWKQWYEFLVNEEYGFNYLLGVTGTPYIGDEYFHDCIYRYSLKQGIDDGIIKTPDYKIEEESEEKGFDETFANHLQKQEKYAGQLKPITIIVTAKIVDCIAVWNDLVKFISEKENISYEESAKKTIWVTSGIPSNSSEKARIEAIITNPEKVRKENLALLKTVDETDNPVEWIVSVSMLTEGWDVKNVFQIVPHEQRAFNSKLLISQVLGRGLRIPEGLEAPVNVKINNHEAWSSKIKDLYKDVLEIENKLSWGYDENKKDYAFPLHNLNYESVQGTTESKKKPAKEPSEVRFKPQSKVREESSTYSETGTFSFSVEAQETVTIDQAAREMKLFLKEKDEKIAKTWSIKKLKEFLIENLEKDGYDSSFLSKENLATAKQSFGPMFRELGKETPRMKLTPDSLFDVKVEDMNRQTFSESSIKDSSYVYYTKNTVDTLTPDQKSLFGGFLSDKENYNRVCETIAKYGGSEDEIKFLKENLFEKPDDNFKCPLNMIFVSKDPERRFTNSLFTNIELIDSFVKSPDKGFYHFPYSYKPTESGSTHVRRENFNPDFFLKLNDKNEIAVIEIKKDGDTSQRNKAKYRDGITHFGALNKKLKEEGNDWEYHFYFLSPDDIPEFFQAVRDGRYKNWKSSLMQDLSTNEN